VPTDPGAARPEHVHIDSCQHEQAPADNLYLTVTAAPTMNGRFGPRSMTPPTKALDCWNDESEFVLRREKGWRRVGDKHNNDMNSIVFSDLT